MKKSEMLMQVRDRLGESSFYICLEIYDQFIDGCYQQQGNATAKKARELIEWITDSLGNCNISVACYGVEAWLVIQGHKPCVTFGNKADDYTMMKYRKRWLVDMAAYWEAQGD
jgi:hypothetical protein